LLKSIRLFDLLLVVHMFGVSIASLLFAAEPAVFAAIFLVTALPLIATAFLSTESIGTGRLCIYGLAFFLPLCVGYFLNPLSVDPIVRLIIVFLIFGIGWICSSMRAYTATTNAFLLAGAIGLIVAFFMLSREGLSEAIEDGARLTGGEESHPNFIGLTMVCVALCANVHRYAIVRYAGSLMGFGLSLAVQSRNAILALIVLMGISAFRDVRRKLGWGGIGFFILLGILAMLVAFTLMENIVSEIFRLDDPYRGTGSGFVGRAQLWQATWELFTAHPFVGFGLGQHVIGAHLEMYAHNMYLIILSESGLLGFMTFLVGCGIAALGLNHLRKTESADLNYLISTMIYCIIIYYVYGIFEGRAINAGNLLSYLFFFALGFGISAFSRQVSSTRAPAPVYARPAERELFPYT